MTKAIVFCLKHRITRSTHKRFFLHTVNNVSVLYKLKKSHGFCLYTLIGFTYKCKLKEKLVKTIMAATYKNFFFSLRWVKKNYTCDYSNNIDYYNKIEDIAARVTSIFNFQDKLIKNNLENKSCHLYVNI